MFDHRQNDPREREGGLRFAMWWLRALAGVGWPFMRKDVGSECPGSCALGSLLLVLGVAMWKDSLEAWLLLWLFILALLRLRAKVRQNRKQGIVFHRYWDGTPWLAQKLLPRVQKISDLKGYEAFILAGIGIALTYADPAVGGLVIASAAASFSVEAIWAQIRRNRVSAMRDAQAEMSQLMDDYHHGF